jgi:hypothetical protein
VLTVLCLIAGLVVTYLGVSFGLHVYRIKTDPCYRDRLALLQLERRMQDKLRTINGSTDRAFL